MAEVVITVVGFVAYLGVTFGLLYVATRQADRKRPTRQDHNGRHRHHYFDD